MTEKTPDTQVIQGRGRWRAFVVATLLFLAPMVCWSLASPLGSVPDEPSHAIMAASVVRGEVFPEPWVDNTSMGRADVPAYVAHLHARTCYVGQAEVPASCVLPVEGDPDRIVTTGSSATANTPVFYAIVGVPTLLLSGDAALYAMRIVSALLCALALGTLVMQLWTLPRRRWALLATAVAATPMVYFLGGSINPNGLEIVTAGALFVTLAAAFGSEAPMRLTWERVGLATVMVALLSNTRSIALLWVLVALGAALVLGKRDVILGLIRKPAAWVLIGAAAILGALAAIGYALPRPYTARESTTADTGPVEAFISIFARTFEYGHDYVGRFGWLDSASPAYSAIVWSAAVVALLVGALVFTSGARRIVVIGLAAALVILPPAIQAVIVGGVGIIWQGRYNLALVVLLIIACGIVLDDRFERLPERTTSVIIRWAIAALALGHVASFLWTLRRYTIGSQGSLVSMLLAPEWQPPLGWIPLTLLYAVVIGVGAVVLARTATPALPRTSTT